MPRAATGHEMFDDVGIIHMNGRIYDPVIARFLQADPVVQDTSDLQAFNRYAYVRNNPLSLTDPSGYSWLSDAFKSVVKAVKTLVKITVAIALAPFAIQAYIARQAFRETGRLFMRVPELQIVANVALAILAPGAIPAFNAWVSAAVTHQSGGGFADVIKGAAVAYISSNLAGLEGTWSASWSTTTTSAASLMFNGAASKAQGGKFFDAREVLKSGAISAFAEIGIKWAIKGFGTEQMKQSLATYEKREAQTQNMDQDAQDSSGLIREDGFYTTGSDNTIVTEGYSGRRSDGGWVLLKGGYVDDFVPGGHTFATFHDAFVGFMHDAFGVKKHNWMTNYGYNYPSMLPAYMLGLAAEIGNLPAHAINKSFGTQTHVPYQHSHRKTDSL